MGPLLDVPQFGPDEDRFDFIAATKAVARQLGALFRGEARAAGLLVFASYNWGTTLARKPILATRKNPSDGCF